MASLDHTNMVRAFHALFDQARDSLEDIAKHITKAKGQDILDVLEQIGELLQRIDLAASTPKLEIEVSRAMARDFDTIAQRWRELEQYFMDKIQYDDYVYRSDEDRAKAKENALKIVRNQALQALDAAGTMFGLAREWRRAAQSFGTVVQARKVEASPFAALPAMIREYRCYEELEDFLQVLNIGKAIQLLLTSAKGDISALDQSMLREAAHFFRKTAMSAVTNRQKNPDINIPLAAIFLWNEAEILTLISSPEDDTALNRFRALSEFFEQIGKEELAKPIPSIHRFVASYMEGAFANLRITRNISGFSAEEARKKSFQLTQHAADFTLTLIERLGYQQVRVVDDSEKAMKGLMATFDLIQRGLEGSRAFLELAKQAGTILIQAQQQQTQSMIDLAMIYRWLFEAAGGGLYVICMKLISDIFREGILGGVLDVGSKEELRQKLMNLVEVPTQDDLFAFLIDREVEFDDVVDLFTSLDLYWAAALCKLNQGQFRQNLSFLEVRMMPTNLAERETNISDDESEVETMPFWGAAPSIDFASAAELYSRAFRLKLSMVEDFTKGAEETWIPHRDPDDLRRRAAFSHWLAGLANLEEGNIEEGGRELFRAKNAYELLDRHREAISCLDVWARRLVGTINVTDGKGARPTQARLEELLNVCDELVGLYALRHTSPNTIDDILSVVGLLQNEVGLENWTLMVYLRVIEYTREALRIGKALGVTNSAIEMLRFLRAELSDFLGSDFAIGFYPNYATEATIYFEAETPVKLAILNVSQREISDLTIRPIGILPHISPSATQPWQISRDSTKVTMKHFYIGCDDEAFEIDDSNYYQKPADAFGPLRPKPVELPTSVESSIGSESSTAQITGALPWLAVMWTGDYNGISIGSLAGVTEEPTSQEDHIASIDDLTEAAFFTVFTKSAREGNMLPGQIFPVTFGIYSSNSKEPVAVQTLFFKIASRPRILKAETNWVSELDDKWDESFSITFEEGASLPSYVPRFAPEYVVKDYVNPQTLTPTITLGSDAVELTKYLKQVPYRFNLRYKGKKQLHTGNNYLVDSNITLEMPVAGRVTGEYEFLRIGTPTRMMTADELDMPRLRNGVNFQELFYGTVYIGDANYDGEYYIYRLWLCFEPGEATPAPGANFRQGWTNHRLDIFLDPKTWEPRLLVTDYYVKFENGHGEWVEALFTFKTTSSTLFGIRRLTADLKREVELKRFPNEFESGIRHSLEPLGIDKNTPLKVTGFALGQRLGFIELIRTSWARNKRDGPVIFKPPRAHLFRDYWSQRYEHGLYRDDWRGGLQSNNYEVKTNDRSGGQSKYIRGFGERSVRHEVGIMAREGDRCDLIITPPTETETELIIRNLINPRKIELWTRPHVSFSRRFNWFAKHFGRPPKVHTASLYFYSTRRELNPYYKGTVRGKDQWIQYPEPSYWNGRQWIPIPQDFHPALHPENLSYGINTWLEADAYWVYRYVWYWPLEFTVPLPHEDWERADIWVNARTGKIEWITSDYHWRELWYQNAVKVSGVNPIIDFLFNWNTPEPLTVKDGAQVHKSIVPYFKEGKQIGEFADQLPWMFARYRQSCEHLHKLHQNFYNRHKVKIIYGGLLFTILLIISIWFFFFTPLGLSWNPFWPPP